MSEYQSEDKKVSFMSALAEASQLVRTIGAGAGPLKEQRLRAWRKLSAKFSWNRVVDLHRGEPRARVTGDELNLLRAVAQKQQEAEREASGEYRELVERISRLEALLISTDAEFGSAHIAGLRQATGGTGSDSGSVD